MEERQFTERFLHRHAMGELLGNVSRIGEEIAKQYGGAKLAGALFPCKGGAPGRAFYTGMDGWDAALGSGLSVIPKAPQFAWAIVSKYWAEGARGVATVFIGNGAGTIFWGTELPMLLQNVNRGVVVIKYVFL